MSKLKALPPGVVRELCQHLNMEGAGVRNWSDLIAHVQGEKELQWLVTYIFAV